MGHAGVADRALLHGFQQRRLRLGRRAVEFVGQQQVGEDRARLEAEVAMAGAVVSSSSSVPRMSLGIRSGVNCTRRNCSSSAWPSERTSSVLPRPGTPSSRQWPAGEQADQQLFDHRVLADDRLGDRAAQRGQVRELGLEVGFGGHGVGLVVHGEGPVSCSMHTSRC
jgi:hypothetical protein